MVTIINQGDGTTGFTKFWILGVSKGGGWYFNKEILAVAGMNENEYKNALCCAAIQGTTTDDICNNVAAVNTLSYTGLVQAYAVIAR